MKKDSFLIQKSKLKLNTSAHCSKYLAGKTIEILHNTGGHSYGVPGTRVKVGVGATITNTSISRLHPSGNTIMHSEYFVVVDETIAEIKEQIAALEEEKVELDSSIKTYKSKIAFMKANGLDKYDEDEFKVYSTLEALENPKTSKMEKAKIIAQLIKG